MSKPNDLHLIFHSRIVMVQWVDDTTARARAFGARNVRLTVTEMMTKEEAIARITMSATYGGEGVPFGEGIVLDEEAREKVIQALRGEAPPCTCEVCAGDAPTLIKLGPST